MSSPNPVRYLLFRMNRASRSSSFASRKIRVQQVRIQTYIYKGRFVGTVAHYLPFMRRLAAMTAELPWTSVDVATGYRGCPRVSTALRLMALPRQMPRLWPRHLPQFCPWQTPSYQPWQCTPATNAKALETFVAVSTAIRGHCDGNHPIGSNIHGSPRQ